MQRGIGSRGRITSRENERDGMDICEVKSESQDCTHKADFVYHGLGYYNKKTRVTYPATPVKMCSHHARIAYMQRIEQFEKGIVFMMNISNNDRRTLTCQQEGGCGQSFRAERVGKPFVKASSRFCPWCGKPCLSETDFDLDYFELLAKELDNMDPRLLQYLYSDWQESTTAYNRFTDYVRFRLNEMRRSIAATKE